MKIDKNRLIELLVEKTDMERDEIEAQLDQLIDRILDAAKRGKALEIKEFGLFYFDEEGELSFDPADELSTEISFKYAGMKPVELKPERDTSIFELEEEETEEPAPFDDWKDELEEESEPVPPADIEEPEEFEIEEEKEAGIEEPEESEEELDDDSLYDPFAEEAMEPLEEPVEEESKTSMDDIKPKASREPVKRSKDNTGIFILIGIIVVAVLIGAYFYYVGTQTQNLDEQAEPTTQTDASVEQEETTAEDNLQLSESESGNEQGQPGEQTAEETQTPSEQESPDQVSEEEPVSDNGISITETDQPLYGLMGRVVEQANDGYSIVLHSFSSEERAMDAAYRLQQDDYRVIITPRTVYENMVWRVSVGQFETLADAQQATTQLPTPYNTQNFIQRIQTN